MTFSLETLRDLAGLSFDDILDVRSPAEFTEDHIPGAVNLPVLSNAERARIGHMYVQVDRFQARRVGGALVARNAAVHLEGYLSEKGGGYRPLVLCWRGGMRSGAFATILRSVGWQTETLAGGYRAYRRAVVDALYEQRWPAKVVLLSGHTGTAKTAILHRASTQGVQIVDLEGNAQHRGSVFGDLGEQPSQKLFETRIAASLMELDPSRPVLVEAESSKVGNRVVPPSLWSAMQVAPRIEVTAALDARAAYTAEVYRDAVADPARVIRILQRLRPYHARDVVDRWASLAATGEHQALAAELMTEHYDRRYDAQAARNDGDLVARIDLDGLAEGDIAKAGKRVAALLNGDEWRAAPR